jgi:hypothetical protein
MPEGDLPKPSIDENHMFVLLSDGGLQYNENAIGPGAQTERRGLAGPVRDLLGGETSPAVFCSSLFMWDGFSNRPSAPGRFEKPSYFFSGKSFP